MRRVIIAVALIALGAVLLGSSPADAAKGPARTYRERAVGVIVSTSQNITSTSGREQGTPIARGTNSGSQAAGVTPPLCAVGSSPVAGSTTTVASTGDILYTTFSGTVCESDSTATSGIFVVTATFSIVGGTGRYAGATGGGTLTSTAVLHATPTGSQGPVVSHSLGTIVLAHLPTI